MTKQKHPKYWGTIPYENFHQAAKNWDIYYDVIGRHDNPNWPSFNLGLRTFLKFDAYNNAKWADTEEEIVAVPKSVARKMKLLASPDFKTIIKIYEIKHAHRMSKARQSLQGS